MPELQPDKDPIAPVPEDNLPGHHPEVEQDKPTGPPPRRSRKLPSHHSVLRRDEPFSQASRLVGVTADNSYVEVDRDVFEVRFGPWHVRTPITNVESAQVTGPFQWWKVIGAPRLSLKDRGVTFATSARAGVCVRFRQPVPGLEPTGLVKHPGVTVTVEDPEELVRVIDELREAS